MVALHSCIINDGWVCSGWTLRATSKTIHEKKGRGIFRRIFHHVPSSGPGSINRRIRSAETLDGSSKLHVVAGGHCKNGAHPVGGELPGCLQGWGSANSSIELLFLYKLQQVRTQDQVLERTGALEAGARCGVRQVTATSAAYQSCLV